MSDENKKNDFDEKLFFDYAEDYCGKRGEIEDEMLSAWLEYKKKIEDAQKRLYDLKKTDGEKYDGSPYEDDVKNHVPSYKVPTGDGLMPVEGAEKITKAVDEAFPKIFDEVSLQLKRLGEDMSKRSAANLAHFAMLPPEMECFSWHLFYREYHRNDCDHTPVGYASEYGRFHDEIIACAKENRFAAIRASYNLALTCETPDLRIVENCERQLERLDDESLDKTFKSVVDGETVVDRQVRAGAAGAVLDFIVEWRLRERFTEWVRDGRPDKSKGPDKDEGKGGM